MDDKAKPTRIHDDPDDSSSEDEAKEEVLDEIQSTTTTLAVKAPTIATNFNQLLMATNLNNPPDNWLKSNPYENLDGFNTRHYLEDQFSSIRMAFDFMRLINNGKPSVDVITASKNIKKMLKLALTDDYGLSMFVHPVNGTLLIDNFDVHKWLLKPNSHLQWKWLREFFLERVLEKRADVVNAIVRKSHTNEALSERNLMSKFLHYSLFYHDSGAHFENNPLVYQLSETERDEDIPDDGAKESNGLPKLPEPEELLDSRQNGAASCDIGVDGHARTLLWSIEDIRMLIGSDMPIFGDKEHPSVSLRLHNLKKPINILTGLDHWLDNLMCQVPEVLMCFHMDGIVQKYEIIKTEDLPRLTNGSKFNEAAVMRVAKNILAFLRRNATKEGHTYWLFKAKDDEYVKLYDLTSLCDEKGLDEKEEEEEEENKNPFKDAVAMLLYKLARNLIHKHRLDQLKMKLNPRAKPEPVFVDSDNKKPSSPDEIARRVLLNCMTLMDKEKYPHIASSASYLLSDIYIPDDLNPLDPNFGKPSPGAEASASQLSQNSTSKLSAKRRKAERRRQEEARLREEEQRREQDRIEEEERNESMKRLEELERMSELHAQEELQRKKKEMRKGKLNGSQVSVSLDDLRNSIPSSPEYKYSEVAEPLPKAVGERCFRALEHVEIGLSWAKYLQAKKSEFEARQKKAQEQQERDNPKMCKPMEPIPMPYKDTSDSSKVEVFTAKKEEWHADLKAVLFRKAFLVYITSAEVKFSHGFYGHCVKAIKRSLNCFFALDQLSPQGHGRNIRMLLSFAYGVAGDAFMILFDNWDSSYISFLEGFNGRETSQDKKIAKFVEEYVDESKREWVLKVPKDVEECLFLALKCFKAALDLCERDANEKDAFETAESLNSRYANALNITSSLYIKKATNMIDADFSMSDIQDLLCGAESMFIESLGIFRDLNNNTNMVIVMSNIGMLYRTWAHAVQNSNGGAEALMIDAEWVFHEKSITFYKEAFWMCNNVGLDSLKPSSLVNLANVYFHSVMEMWQRSFLATRANGEARDFNLFLRPFNKVAYTLDMLRVHFYGVAHDNVRQDFYLEKMGTAGFTIGSNFLKFMLEHYENMPHDDFDAFVEVIVSILTNTADIFYRIDQVDNSLRAFVVSMIVLVFAGRIIRDLTPEASDPFVFVRCFEVLKASFRFTQERWRTFLEKSWMAEEPFTQEEFREAAIINKFIDFIMVKTEWDSAENVAIKSVGFCPSACLKALIHLFKVQLKECYGALLKLDRLGEPENVAIKELKILVGPAGLNMAAKLPRVLETLMSFQRLDDSRDLIKKPRILTKINYLIEDGVRQFPCVLPMSLMPHATFSTDAFIPNFDPSLYTENLLLVDFDLSKLTTKDDDDD